MDRRNFLKQVSLYSAGMLLAPPVFHIMDQALAGTLTRPQISVVKGEGFPEMVRAVLDSLGGIKAFIRPSDKVVIKPNIGWDRSVDQAANTHPEIVVELAKQCLDSGASQVKIFDRTCNESRRCYSNSGVKSAVKQIKNRRVRLEHIDDRKFIPVTIEKSKVLEQWSFYRDALEADVYINVPVAKHHSLSGLSLGLKNIMGAIGGWRGKLHSNLAEKLADLNTVLRPDLVFVDATRVIVRNGPQGGNLSDVKILNTMAASRDPVAVDAFATTLFNLDPSAIPITVAAAKRGLGQIDLNQCEIKQVRM